MVRCWWTCEHRQTNRFTLSLQCSLTSGQRRDLKQPDKTVSRSSKLFTSFVKGCARSVAKEETQCRPRLGCQEPVTLSIMQTDRLTTQPAAELNQLKHHNPICKDNRHTRHIHSFQAAVWDIYGPFPSSYYSNNSGTWCVFCAIWHIWRFWVREVS